MAVDRLSSRSKIWPRYDSPELTYTIRVIMSDEDEPYPLATCTSIRMFEICVGVAALGGIGVLESPGDVFFGSRG